MPVVRGAKLLSQRKLSVAVAELLNPIYLTNRMHTGIAISFLDRAFRLADFGSGSKYLSATPSVSGSKRA